MRIYDPRVGRFLSVDPITSKYPELTPYQFASNTPIAGVDQDGLEFASYLLTRIKGVGQIETNGSIELGVILGGFRINGAVGIAYDKYNNLALYYSKGGFADLFGALNGPSKGGNPKETGEFSLFGGISVTPASESYNWGYNSVLDLKGDASNFNVNVSLYRVIGVTGGVNMNSDGDAVGVNLGVQTGVGAPLSFGITQSNTSLLAFRLGDIKKSVKSLGNLKEQLKKLGIDNYDISVSEDQQKDGFIKLSWTATYKDKDGNSKTNSVDMGS